MYSSKNIADEIRQVIDNLIKNKVSAIRPDAVVEKVLDKHGKNDVLDSYFVYCAYETTRREVRKQISRFKVDIDGMQDRQIVLPGFSHLQEYYLITRQGEQVAAHIHDMTRQELLAKKNELLEMSKGCLAHANEIDKYLASLEDAA